MSDTEKIECILSESLDSKNITDYDIITTYESTASCTHVYVKKTINGEKFRAGFTLTDEILTVSQDLRKVVSHNADKIVKEIYNEVSEIYEWKNQTYGDNVQISVRTCDELSARCEYCNKKIEISPERVSPLFKKNAELSTPNPVPVEVNSLTENLSNRQEVLLRMYLIGRARDSCVCDSDHYRKV